MNISIFGTGNMASGLAVLFAKAGHTVTVSSAMKPRQRPWQPNWATASAPARLPMRQAPPKRSSSPSYEAAATSSAAGGLAGKIVIDITNPLAADFSA